MAQKNVDIDSLEQERDRLQARERELADRLNHEMLRLKLVEHVLDGELIPNEVGGCPTLQSAIRVKQREQELLEIAEELAHALTNIVPHGYNFTSSQKVDEWKTLLTRYTAFIAKENKEETK